MRKNDARKLNRKSQEALRIRGVQAVQSGESPTKIAEMLGVNQWTIFNWLSKYREGGWNNLKQKKISRPSSKNSRSLFKMDL